MITKEEIVGIGYKEIDPRPNKTSSVLVKTEKQGEFTVYLSNCGPCEFMGKINTGTGLPLHITSELGHPEDIDELIKLENIVRRFSVDVECE